MGIFELLLLSVGLAMDAFAVSICKGLAIKRLTIKEALICGLWFGVFQALMPMAGYLVGSGFKRFISMAAPWVAFIFLSVIGINMIIEAFSKNEKTDPGLDHKTMFLMAVATSIDALAVGIAFVAIPVKVLSAPAFINTVFAALLIGLMTFAISSMGVRIGNIFGTRYRSGAELTGGIILILIGLNSLIGFQKVYLAVAEKLGQIRYLFNINH